LPKRESTPGGDIPSKQELIRLVKQLGEKYVIPFPVEWTVENWPEQVWKWIQYMKGELELESKTIKYTLSMHSYRGPIHIRGMWIRTWYLFLDDKGKGKVRVFRLEGFPLVEDNVLAFYEGRESRKYLDWEGKTKPRSRFNPNKQLVGEMKIVTKGTVEYSVEHTDKGEEVITLRFKTGGMKGEWRLEQEEKGSDAYALYRVLPELQGKTGRFVYHRHCIGTRCHYDLRYMLEGEDYVKEFNLYGDLREVGLEEPIPAVYKHCYDPSWMDITEQPEKRKVGGLWTLVEPIDSGSITVYNEDIDFINFTLRGNVLKDVYCVAKKTEQGWVLFKSRLPGMELDSGDPAVGPYSKFPIEEKSTWDHFIVRLYDLRYFTRCEPSSKVKEYLPDLEIPEGVTVGVCLYPRLGRIHGARVAYVIFKKDKWDYDKAEQWIRKHNLHNWQGEQIREKRT